MYPLTMGVLPLILRRTTEAVASYKSLSASVEGETRTHGPPPRRWRLSQLSVLQHMIVFPISQEVDYGNLTYFHMHPRRTFHNLYTTRLCSLITLLK